MLVIRMKLEGGRLVAVVPSAVAAFEEVEVTMEAEGSRFTRLHGAVRMLDGRLYVHEWIPSASDLPQVELLVRGFAAGVEQVLANRQDKEKLRNSLVFPGVT